MGLKFILSNIETFSIDEAFNGAEALKRIEENQKEELNYKIVFMDINMPVMDGLEATKFIKEKIDKKIFKDLVIIAVTAYTQEKEKEKYIKIGMNSLIPKPITFYDTLKVLQEIFLK